MSNASILPARLDWPSAIGSFLLNFGTLEYFVFVFLKDSVTEEEFAKVKEWHLKNRLDRIAQHLKDQNYPEAEQAAFADLIKRLEPIRDLRNYIAHGHMYFRYDPATKKARVTLMRAKDLDNAHLPETKILEFSELERALTALTSLISEFEHLAGFTSDKPAR